MKEIEKAFLTEGRSVYSLFQQVGLGFYIPLYQREYSWDADNVQQLISDLSRGVESLCANEEEEIRFLGTLITVTENDKNKIQPQDTQALPTSIEVVIDGQQRLTTLVLLASQIYLLIQEEEIRLKKAGPEFAEMEEVCSIWRSRLKEIFALDLRKGIPRIKPKIIRGQADKWIKEGPVDSGYTSPAAKYIGEFIQFITDVDSGSLAFRLTASPSVDKTKVGKSIKQFNKWLVNNVAKAHLDSGESEFPSAKTILAKTNQEFIWDYGRDNLKKIIDEADVHDSKSGAYHLCALVQLFAVSHYMLERCCFTVIKPVSDKWAFDMFQSLNATGTPLTAIETFKPLVVNTVETIDKKVFKDSADDKWFMKVEGLFADTKTASEKNKLTSDFLTSFALVADTENPKLSSHFSAQRKWIDKFYNEKVPGTTLDAAERSASKHAFVKFFGQYADFYKSVWMNYLGASGTVLPLLVGRPDAELASVILLYLNQSNHRMAITILAQYYIVAQNSTDDDERNGLIDGFISAVKAIGAFYTLWRSAQSNSGLDAKYRTFFKGTGSKNADGQFDNAVAWLQRTSNPSVPHLKQYLRESLTNMDTDPKEPFTKETWLTKAKTHLDYNSRWISKFVLLLYAHDTIPDPEHPGLAKEGVKGSNLCLTLNHWKSADLETLEHVAPRKSDGTWDAVIYSQETFNRIGNLILLPANVNTSASNKGWTDKLLYYKHLGQQDPDVLTQLTVEAIKQGFEIPPSTIEIMRKAAHQPHINVLLGMDGVKEWNADFIEQRTERILSLLWDRLSKWLE